MKNMFSKLKPQHGVTLVEILMAVTITAIISAAAIEVYITQHQSYIWQERITEMNMNANVAMEELVKKISEAGNGMPTGIAGELPFFYSKNANPDTIEVLERDLGDSGYWGMEMFGACSGLAVYNCVACNDTGGPYGQRYGVPTPYMDIDAGDIGMVADPIQNFCDTFTVTGVYRIVGTHLTHSPSMGVNAGSYITKIQFYRFYLRQSTALNHCDTTGWHFVKSTKVWDYTCSYDTASDLILVTRTNNDTTIVASNITDLQFTYIMANGVSSNIASPNIPVDRVTISLTARTEKKVQGNRYRYKTLTQTVKIKGGRAYRDLW